MHASHGTERVEDDELLYRRIPVSTDWYKNEDLSAEAFNPRENETTGISLYRAKYKSIEAAAKGKSKKGYYIAVLRTRELRSNGFRVEPRPREDDPGHVELPDLTCDNRESDEALERKSRLTKLCERVDGPFYATDP